ncbi:MAG: ABC transporter ATP-binding protein [Thermoguttaceae bacterium]|nr:ABC transporter ATP-binding protein [Thermoguttaceae bacterium]
MDQPFFEISDLTCVRGGKTILSGVGFTLRKGEVAALLGQNGAGKSTLLKCIMRLLPAETSFRATLEGRDLAELSARELAQKIVYVPQIQTQSFPFTVRQFIEAARYAHQSPWNVLTSADRALCEKVLAQTGLSDFADRPLSTLSGGELQRVWLAGALAQNGEILLLDEAFSQMDYRNRAEIFALLHQLNREEEKTILFITHEINEAVQNANRILTLKSGKLLFDGTTADFLASDWLETTFETSFLRIPHPELPFPAVLPIKQLNEMP